MKDFNLAKYLKENYQGPFSMFQPYVDLNPLKEESEEQLDTEIPYKGPDPHLDGMGSEFDQVAPVEEAFSAEQEKFDRMMGLIDRTLEAQLPKIKNAVDKARDMMISDKSIFNMLSTSSITKQAVKDLVDDGFDPMDIVDFFATDFTIAEDGDNVTAADNAAYGADQEAGEPFEEEVTVSSSGVEM